LLTTVVAMGRPFTASDEDILHAAGKVIARRGPDAFSIAEVAADVGLSRAAIILRFKSTHALKVTLLERMVEEFSSHLKTLPQSPGGDNVLRLAAFVGSYVHSRQSSARFFSTYSNNIQDRDLRELERKRGEVLFAAVSKVLPEVAIDHTSAVAAFSAHLSGSIVAWLAHDDEDSRGYLVMRTREWLKLAGIAFSEGIAEELSAAPPTSAGEKSASRSRRRKKATRSTSRAPR
jgi:TetR/AcrR family macrolide resistance operon transcriptional repressor